MPAALQTLIDAQILSLLYIYAEWNNMYNDFYNLAGQLATEGNPNSAQSLYNACVHILNIRDYIGTGTSSYKYTENATLSWINDNWPSGGDPYELTLEKMLTAIWDGDIIRWFLFVNYIDSMRAGIWNIEIYDTHLAEWYRHFSVTG